jgi:hypothetical protein
MSVGGRRSMDLYAGFHPLFTPLQAAAHWARRFMPAPHAGHTQALTRGARSRVPVSAGLRSGGTTAQKWNVPHISYAWCPISSGIVVTTASTPVSSAMRRPDGSESWS